MVRVAVVQMNPVLAEKDRNLHAIEEGVAAAATAGARLAVFPECSVTGYVYASLEEALGVAEEIPGPASDRIVGVARQHDIYLTVGLLERSGNRCFNSALLCGPEGLIAVYRKTHTLCLGVDRFTTKGDVPFTVHELPIGRIGMLICYDLRFPEPARILALGGADMILLPTNWPVASTIQPDVYTRARASENRVFVLAADRVGQERGAGFLGRSQIVSPDGAVLSEAPGDAEDILVLDIDPSEARQKNLVVRPGEHEMDAFADRRPDLYGPLLEALASPVGA